MTSSYAHEPIAAFGAPNRAPNSAEIVRFMRSLVRQYGRFAWLSHRPGFYMERDANGCQWKKVESMRLNSVWGRQSVVFRKVSREFSHRNPSVA